MPLSFHRANVMRASSVALRWLSITLLVFLIFLPLGFLGWLAFATDTFAIANITVVDARPHTVEEINTLLAQELGKNILFVRTDTREQQIARELPQVRTVHVARVLPNTLKVIVQEKTPALLFLSKGKYYFVDDQGIAYEEARLDTLPGTVLPTVKNNDREADIRLGIPAVEERLVSFVVSGQERVAEVAGAQVAEIRIPSLAAREVHFLLNNNWEIRFDIMRDTNAQLEVLRKLLENTITPEERAVLEYIDLRIPNRVYYKTSEAVSSKP